MQDKHRHIDEKYTDLGWEEMRKLLDQELPVEKRRKRRFGWWFLLLGLGLGMAVGYAAFSYFGEVEPVHKTVNTDRPVADAGGMENLKNEDVAPSSDTGFTSGNTATTNLSASTAEQGKVEATDQEKSTYSSNQKIDRVATSSATKTERVVEKNASPDVVTQEQIAGNQQINAVEVPVTIPEKTTNSTNQQPAEQQPIQWASLDDLAKLPIAPLREKTPVFPAFETDYSIQTPGSLSLRTGLTTAFGTRVKGWHAGIVKNKQLGDSKWSLDVGAEYSWIQQPLQAFADTADLNTGIEEPSGIFADEFTYEQGNTSAPAAADIVDVTASDGVQRKLNLHYLRIPVHLNYRVADRLRLMGGGQAAMLLKAGPNTNRDELLGGLFNFDDEADTFSNGRSGGGFLQVRNIDFSISGGIGYDLDTNLSLEFLYKSGLSDVLTSNRTKDRNQLAELSLRYRLGR